MRLRNQASDAIRVQSSIEEELIIKDQLHFPMNEIALEERDTSDTMMRSGFDFNNIRVRMKDIFWRTVFGKQQKIAKSAPILGPLHTRHLCKRY